MATFEKLAIQSEGIDRLGVLRADVDNLGAAFTNGFVREREENVVDRNRYLTLSRFATLSRQLSMFFKHHINGLLRGQTALEGLSLKPDLAGGRKKAVIVYSGGDDMFIIGSWNDVIELAVDLRHAFRIYTADSLSFQPALDYILINTP